LHVHEALQDTVGPGVMLVRRTATQRIAKTHAKPRRPVIATGDAGARAGNASAIRAGQGLIARLGSSVTQDSVVRVARYARKIATRRIARTNARLLRAQTMAGARDWTGAVCATPDTAAHGAKSRTKQRVGQGRAGPGVMLVRRTAIPQTAKPLVKGRSPAQAKAGAVVGTGVVYVTRASLGRIALSRFRGRLQVCL